MLKMVLTGNEVSASIYKVINNIYVFIFNLFALSTIPNK